MLELKTSPPEIIGKRVAEHDASGNLVFDAEAVAPLLGLEPAAFMEELRKGVVYQTHERGTEEDIGKNRVTFRYRACQSILTVDRHGCVTDVA